MKASLANTAASALYVGEVVHQRSRSFDHRLRYRVWMVLADLDELDGLQSRLGLLGRGRFGLISFRSSDHGDRSGRPLRAQVEAHLAGAGIDIAGGPIRIGGDGTPFRSYLYAADLAEWLYTILLRGESGRAYNVGSEEAVSIRHLADRVADVAATVWPDRGRPEVIVAKQPVPGSSAERYVPSCQRACVDLGLAPATSLDEAIRRTLVWAKEKWFSDLC